LDQHDVKLEIERPIIETELGQVIAFAIDGAVRLAKRKKFTPLSCADALKKRWRVSASSALEFLHDPDWCELGERNEVDQVQLYKAYRRWCVESGRHQLGRNSFYESIDQGGSLADVFRRKSGDRLVCGVRLKV